MLAVLLASWYVVELQLACEESVDALGDFVTAGADGRTNARVDVGRVTSEVSGHGLYASYNNATCRSTPAAVYQGQYVLKRIIEYNRHTIGKRKSECYSWLMSDECV